MTSYVGALERTWEARPTELGPYHSTSNYAAADEAREKLVAGRRIRVTRLSPTLRGLRGVIVAMAEVDRIGSGDCAVLLDDWDHPLGFFWNEIETEVVVCATE